MSLDLYDLRRREVQAIGAAISTRDWHAVEQAYNSLRDKLDRAGFTVAGPRETGDALARAIFCAINDCDPVAEKPHIDAAFEGRPNCDGSRINADNCRIAAQVALTASPATHAGSVREECAAACDRIANDSLFVGDNEEGRVRHAGIIAGARNCAAAIRALHPVDSRAQGGEKA